MKILIPVLAACLVGCGQAPAPKPIIHQVVVAPEQRPEGCTIDTQSNRTTKHVVGPIMNLVKDVEVRGMYSQCTVNFDISVNGEVHHVEETYVGWEQTEALCYIARDKGRKNLLLDLDGEFESQTKIDCRHTENG